MPPSRVVRLLIDSPDALPRCREPVTCGVPWPRGTLFDLSRLTLSDANGQAVPLQARVLDRWSDGSLRWALLDWQATTGDAQSYQLSDSGAAAAPTESAIRTAIDEPGRVRIDTGRVGFSVRSGDSFPLESVGADRGVMTFTVEDAQGRLYRPRLHKLRVEEPGPIRAAVCAEGELVAEQGEPLADFCCRMHFFAGSATVRFHLTIRNPRKADHPGGLWGLGSGGSIYLRDASLTISLPPGVDASRVRCSPGPGAPFESGAPPLELHQGSSGGENWQSRNHVNRRRVVPNTFRGYCLRYGGSERFGLRATPIVSLDRGGASLTVAMPYFWQNFPKAVEASADSLTLRLFPRQYADVHELQGGEQKTHIFFVAFAPDTVTEEPLSWCRAPLLPHATPDWYATAEAVPYLTPRSEDSHADYLRLVDAAIDGDDTFARKREMIDEYGWRHFGDVYGDHEAVFHQGAEPLVSHYNNQYDVVAGFAIQYLRSADERWWRAMTELVWHVIDIDIYHTDRDKSAYNHGLFWHTFHYVDADTANHRSYPARYAATVRGGGPANEQNYATGLMLHYFLTGDEASRQAAISLARWVIDMDDGRKTVFRWLAAEATGLASMSRSSDYHGPGRGAANSVAALLDGHRLTGEPAFLDKAEELIRRVIHPADDVPARRLLDAENRWFYTMFLQSLGKYLDYKTELGQIDFLYAYAQASLLHYARWMAENEYPYLNKPEILEYPTETWVAQDMRKSEIFQYALLHATGAERAKFLERAQFFFNYAVTTLSGMKTRTLCRPVVLMLNFGFMRAWVRRHPEATAAPPDREYDFGRPQVFVPQKTRALKRAKLLATALAVVGLTALVVLLHYFV